jgi:2-hydroxychromene-2-carboxylate isomerase
VTATLGFWFDYSCPYAYLASTRLAAIEAAYPLKIRYEPMLLGGIFRAREVPQFLAGTLGPAKARHLANDLARWSEALGAPFEMPAEHPFRTVEALRVTLATGIDPRVVHGFFRAYWVEGKPVSAPATLRRVLGEAGYAADEFLKRLDDPVAGPQLRDDLRARTDRALALGLFGAPAWEIEGRTFFWGQDRVDFALRAMGFADDRLPDIARPEPLPPSPGVARPMPHTLEFYWDFSSPYAYLGSTQAKALAERTGATLVSRPMLLGAVFKAIGQNSIPMETFSEAKRAYGLRDMHDWAEHWGVPFAFNPTFPLNSVKALRCYLALPEDRQDAFREATFRAAWADGKNIGDDAVLRELLGDDADTIFEQTQTPAIKQALFAATDRAVAAGAFGAPTWVVDGEKLFFGQDRLPLVERALRR